MTYDQRVDYYEQSYPPSLWEPIVEPTAAPVVTGDPTDSWTKAAIAEWLAGVGVDANPDTATKAELLALVSDYLDAETDDVPDDEQ